MNKVMLLTPSTLSLKTNTPIQYTRDAPQKLVIGLYSKQTILDILSLAQSQGGVLHKPAKYLDSWAQLADDCFGTPRGVPQRAVQEAYVGVARTQHV
jgi:hypothetical protein